MKTIQLTEEQIEIICECIISQIKNCKDAITLVINDEIKEKIYDESRKLCKLLDYISEL